MALGRREFLLGSACAVLASKGLSAVEIPSSVIDTHIHLFDPTRFGGIPWPKPEDGVLYQPALPARYQGLSQTFGVVGAIAVECSPVATDNDWLLRVAEQNPIMVGVIGNLDPALDSFPADLDRLAKNPLFTGIRYGNLWGRDLGARLKEPKFVEHLKFLAAKGLLLESANPNPILISDLRRLTELVPNIRVVIDHLPQAPPPAGLKERGAYLNDLRELAKQPKVWVKGTEILRRIAGEVPQKLDFYSPWLDEIWKLFGDGQVLFGSDWPNSDSLASFSDTCAIAREYISGRSRKAQEQYFWRNSIAAYGWKPRTPAQEKLHG